MDRQTDPAADPEVERVARILAADVGDPEQPKSDGDPLWRSFVKLAISAIAANMMLRLR